MSTFGVRVRNAEGVITFDTTMRVMRNVNTLEIAAGSSGSVNLLDYSSDVNNFFMVPHDGNFDNAMPFLSVVGSTLTWEAHGFNTTQCMLIFMVPS